MRQKFEQKPRSRTQTGMSQVWYPQKSAGAGSRVNISTLNYIFSLNIASVHNFFNTLLITSLWQQGQVWDRSIQLYKIILCTAIFIIKFKDQNDIKITNYFHLLCSTLTPTHERGVKVCIQTIDWNMWSCRYFHWYYTWFDSIWILLEIFFHQL